MYSRLSPIGSHIVTFAKQYRESELRAPERTRAAAPAKRLRGTTWRKQA